MEDTCLGVDAVFLEFNDHLVKEQEIKEDIRAKVKEIEQAGREIHATLQKVHRPGGIHKIGDVISQAKEQFGKVKNLYKSLSEKITPQSYWRFNVIWQSTNSWLSFLATLTIYLETESLAQRSQVADMLGVSTEPPQFCIDLEEYLSGLCHLSNELSRMSVNSVTSRDYQRPVRIAGFISSLNTGFRMLNLKNDGLRKKFDSIKYDLKKIEEVVYDLSIRGLIKELSDVKVENSADQAAAAGLKDEKKEAAAGDGGPPMGGEQAKTDG